jgi:hypothetical protein
VRTSIQSLSVTSPPRPAHDANPIAQLEIVFATWRNRIAGLVGAIAGLVPYGAYRLGHYEVTSWDPRQCPKVLVVIAALAFSVLTVTDWAHQVFATENKFVSVIKALGFTALIEALMMTSDYRPLSLGCLYLLVAVNAVANGCRLAVRAASHRATGAERAAVRPGRDAKRPTSVRDALRSAMRSRAVPPPPPSTTAETVRAKRPPRKRPARDTTSRVVEPGAIAAIAEVAAPTEAMTNGAADPAIVAWSS